MRTWPSSLVGTVFVLLLGGLAGPVVAQADEAETMAFPTGTFEAEAGGGSVEFNADGTCRWFSADLSLPCTYVVIGDLLTEMTADRPGGGPKVPATYTWDYDGERLAFEVWGQDPNAARLASYADHTYRPVGETVPLQAPATDFPTGTFVSVGRPHKAFEFHEGGSGRDFLVPGNVLAWEVPFTYGVNGNLYSVMAARSSSTEGPYVPVTYYWDFDGEHLTFELWGEDLRPHRKESYAQTYQRVEDPRDVVVAAADFPAGRKINIHAAKLGLVAAA